MREALQVLNRTKIVFAGLFHSSPYSLQLIGKRGRDEGVLLRGCMLFSKEETGRQGVAECYGKESNN